MKNLIDYLNNGGIIAVITFATLITVLIKMAVTILVHPKDSGLSPNDIMEERKKQKEEEESNPF